MATYNDVIVRGFSKAGIKASETPLTAEEIEDGYDVLIDMLEEWQNSGIPLEYTEPSSKSDEMPVPNAALAAIKSGLTVRLASEFERPISPGMAANAETAYSNMLTALITIGDSSLTGLPRGSGNWDGTTQDYYPDESV